MVWHGNVTQNTMGMGMLQEWSSWQLDLELELELELEPRANETLESLPTHTNTSTCLSSK